MNDKVIALDIAKEIFHAVILSKHGKELKRKKLKRNELVSFIAKQDISVITMEACGASNHWGRTFESLGYEVSLLPPQHVKAYARGQKNDYNDAVAIGEAYLHGRIRPVQIKTVEQQTEQAFHRMRSQLVQQRGDLVRQLRGLLSDQGFILRKGVNQARAGIVALLGDEASGLNPFFRQILQKQYEHLKFLEKELDWYNKTLDAKAKNDEQTKRLLTIPGFGPVVASVFKVWIGSGKQFDKGKYASAALGIVPRQHSSGGKDVLLGITKRGDCYLRSLVIHGARAVVKAAKKKNDRLSRWINELVERRGKNKATVALANKLVRIAWAMTVRNETYDAAAANLVLAARS